MIHSSGKSAMGCKKEKDRICMWFVHQLSQDNKKMVVDPESAERELKQPHWFIATCNRPFSIQTEILSMDVRRLLRQSGRLTCNKTQPLLHSLAGTPVVAPPLVR